MEPVFQKNMSILERSDPALAARIAALGDDPAIVVHESRDGNRVPELRAEGKTVLLHSRFDPVKEAGRLLADFDPQEYDLVIVFGVAFAYHLEALLPRLRPDATLLALERRAGTLRAAMASRDLGALLADRRVRLAVDPDEEALVSLLSSASSYRITFITHRGSFQADPAYYNNLVRLVKASLSRKEVNIATLARFEKSWSANIARNINAIVAGPGAGAFFGRFAGVPAIVAAAGPSLSMSMDFIRANRDRAVIVAVDTSYRILRKHGVEPHFCLSVDAQLVNARYFECDTRTRAVLVADPTVHPAVLRLFRSRAAVAGMAFPMMKWIDEIAGGRGELAYGGSVSTNAYDFARRLGASPIVLVGQDLAFTGGRAHARGSYLEEEVYLRVGRLWTMESFNRRQLTALPKILVKGIRTPSVHTNQKMMIFHGWFSRQNDANLVNATYDGAQIAGVRSVAPEEIAIGEPPFDIAARVDECYGAWRSGDGDAASAKKHLLKKVSAMHDELQALLPVLARAETLSGELVALVRRGSRDRSRFESIMGRLAEADRAVESTRDLKDMIGFTIQRVIHTITEGYEIDEAEGVAGDDERAALRSQFMYRGLHEGARYNRKLLRTMMTLLAKGGSQ